MKIYHKLRTKLIVVFFLVTLIPALITGIYAIQVSSKTLQTQAIATQTMQAQTLAKNVTSFLATVRGDVLFLSQSPVMVNYLEHDTQNIDKKRQVLEQEFLALSRHRRIYYQLRYLDATGQEIARVDSNGLRSEIIPVEKLQEKSNRYYFIDTVRLFGKEIFVSPLDLNRERGKIEIPHKPVIRYAVNVYNQQGDKAGIVIANVDANQFLKRLEAVRLVDQEGYFSNHPDIEKRWGGPVDLNTGHNIQKEYPKFSEQILEQQGTISTSTITLSYHPVKVPGTLHNWTLIIQEDTTKILQTVTDFRVMFSLILMLAVMIALIIAWLVSATITRPIEQLTSIAETISKGELVTHAINIQDKGEIGRLAQAFERMRVSMIKSFERLRKHSKK